jgi:flagellar biosynthesis/type III secretory pathway M-ring protein FliF/YscJ
VDPLVVLLVLVAVAVTVAIIAAPLRAGRAVQEESADAAAIADLEAAKEAKYREIREAEFDYRTGKLSEADWRTVDRELRAEAMELLRRLDELTGAPQR